MQRQLLGRSNLLVSRLCLGTMTFGEQNTLAEAKSQLDYAYAQGINFIDTAEMYPVPANAQTQGLTENYVGQWLRHQARDQIVLATKAAGPSRGYVWLRGQNPMNAANLRTALEGSLRRLQTDYVDLYQLHWPDRYVPMFGQTHFEAGQLRPTVNLHEQLSTLAEFVTAGKVRYIGVSNETAWGIHEFLRLAAEYELPTLVSIQNAYHLLNRTFEMTLAESCHYAQIPLLAYSPLAFGVLSGKYIDQPTAQGRHTRFPAFCQRYRKPNVEAATRAYYELATQHQLTLTQLALAFVQQQAFVGSTIIGATTLGQLAENIASHEIILPPEVLAKIEHIHQQYPNPAP